MAKGDKERKKKWLERKNSFSRRAGIKGKPFERLLIVCEGERTERLYFEQFRATSAEIRVVGTGFNTISLVNEALRLQNLAKRNEEPYDQVWCVFDRDSFPAAQVDNAWHMARKKNLRTALSNEAFELWYILHFDYLSAAHSRGQYKAMLSTRLGHEYLKNDPNMYHELLPFQKNAIKNARKLILKYEKRSPSRDNPCTEVFELVLELNRQR